MENVNKT